MIWNFTGRNHRISPSKVKPRLRTVPNHLMFYKTQLYSYFLLLLCSIFELSFDHHTILGKNLHAHLLWIATYFMIMKIYDFKSHLNHWQPLTRPLAFQFMNFLFVHISGIRTVHENGTLLNHAISANSLVIYPFTSTPFIFFTFSSANSKWRYDWAVVVLILKYNVFHNGLLMILLYDSYDMTYMIWLISYYISHMIWKIFPIKINLMLLTSSKLLVAMIHSLLFKTDPKN